MFSEPSESAMVLGQGIEGSRFHADIRQSICVKKI
jgi:hypothetical protein